MTFKTGNCRYSQVLGSILARHVGRGQQITVEALAKRAGLSPAVIYELQRGKYRASFEAAMQIVQALPDEAAEEWHNALGFFGLTRIDDVEGCHREATMEIGATVAMQTKAWADGGICHVEDSLLRRQYARVQTVLSRLTRRSRERVAQRVGA